MPSLSTTVVARPRNSRYFKSCGAFGTIGYKVVKKNGKGKLTTSNAVQNKYDYSKHDKWLHAMYEGCRVRRFGAGVRGGFHVFPTAADARAWLDIMVGHMGGRRTHEVRAVLMSGEVAFGAMGNSAWRDSHGMVVAVCTDIHIIGFSKPLHGLSMEDEIIAIEDAFNVDLLADM
jgi:hypothetical protein